MRETREKKTHTLDFSLTLLLGKNEYSVPHTSHSLTFFLHIWSDQVNYEYIKYIFIYTRSKQLIWLHLSFHIMYMNILIYCIFYSVVLSSIILWFWQFLISLKFCQSLISLLDFLLPFLAWILSYLIFELQS